MSQGETVLILGATGMVGGHALAHALAHPQVKEVRTLGRRKLTLEHPKLRQWVAADLEKLDDEACFQGVTACLFCVGAYTGALDSDAFRRINVDLPLTVARALQRYSPDARFALLSGQGADRSEKSRVQFARDKGAAENQLAALGLGGFATFRPGYIYPVVPRKEPNLGYVISRWIYPLIRRHAKFSIPSDVLAKVMVEVALQPMRQEIWENEDMRRHSLAKG